MKARGKAAEAPDSQGIEGSKGHGVAGDGRKVARKGRAMGNVKRGREEAPKRHQGSTKEAPRRHH